MEQVRMAAGLDLTVIAALLHAVLLVALFVWVGRAGDERR
jgi:hypothetical protein